MNLGLTYDDVCLKPQFNNIESRLEPDLSSWLTKDMQINIPIVAANMESVIGDELANVLFEYGSIPIFHRFTTIEQKIKWVREFYPSFLSVGIKDSEQSDFYHIHNNVGFSGICIDIAHGHDKRVMNFISDVKKRAQDIQIIAGNVCTADGYRDLVNAGADAVKVGVGPGAACTTRMVTGFGIPQFSAILECAEAAKKLRVPIIADGGIRNSRDIVLALAAGASTVMIGKLFAATKESAAKKTYGRAIYRGQASESFQTEYFGEVKKGTVPEGHEGGVDATGSARDLIDQLLGGIRSAMTYGGARNIKELQRKAEFVQVTPNYHIESNTRL